jgi:hypothetical protein
MPDQHLLQGSREGLENIHCWIEQLDPTVNVLQAAQIDPLDPSFSATLKRISPLDLLLKGGENGAERVAGLEPGAWAASG